MLSCSLQRKPGSADSLTFFWLRNCERISSMSLQGPELWSFIWQPWGTKTPQFLLWKLPGLTTSVWSVAIVFSLVERSGLRPAGGALPTLTGGFWNGGSEQRKRAKCSSEGPSKCVSSATDPQDAVSLLRPLQVGKRALVLL